MERFVTALLCLLLPGATAYPNGAPVEACRSGRPLHGDFLPQGGSTAAFEITANTSSYGPSQTILVTISSRAGLTHKGFLLQVVTSSGRHGHMVAAGQWKGLHNSTTMNAGSRTEILGQRKSALCCGCHQAPIWEVLEISSSKQSWLPT
ncbi:Dfp3 protein [Plakobranchus ocellatus]|uniref:Dfp3 protein n=1 Tax=Plakobranchus ocellatus TaxID=259542 RepID=A0AAV3ZZ64_9GAST|nr:Dfp3 protein [Plakobranchus ocellatus]